MDILQKYEQEHPQAFTTPQKQMPSMAEQSFFASMIRRLSGGRIQDARQASYALIGFVVLMLLTSLVLIFINKGASPIHSITTSDVLPR